MVADALLVVAGYLVGSIPWGLIVVRLARGDDIRSQGSGNIGASNVWRTYGKSLGIPVAVLDVLKGFVPALVGYELGGDWIGVLAGAAAMLGHARPVYLGFRRGGKMVATAGGVTLALAPLAALCGLAVWLVIFAVLRFASVASIVTALVLPLLCIVFGASWPVVGFAALAGLGVIALHRQNIGRLFAGTEPRFTRREPRVPRLTGASAPRASAHCQTTAPRPSPEVPHARQAPRRARLHHACPSRAGRHQVVAPSASPAQAATWCGTPASSDRAPQAAAGFSVHLVYAIPSDGVDQLATWANAMQTDAESADAWWRREDPARSLRFDTFAFPCGTQLDITTLRLPVTGAVLDPIDGRAERTDAGLQAPTMLLSPYEKTVVYYDGPDSQGRPTVCGQGAVRSRSSTSTPAKGCRTTRSSCTS